ncbi:hypothetical protein [Alteribacillus sp. YIM 98480]|uniref:hypothetical protein n=1 Tax=Alteribacillus sp. YIM 98480 TaxID=2606599 RepID=UPI00351ACA01
MLNYLQSYSWTGEDIEKSAAKEAKAKKHKSTRKTVELLGITQSSFIKRLKKYNLQ